MLCWPRQRAWRLSCWLQACWSLAASASVFEQQPTLSTMPSSKQEWMGPVTASGVRSAGRGGCRCAAVAAVLHSCQRLGVSALLLQQAAPAAAASPCNEPRPPTLRAPSSVLPAHLPAGPYWRRCCSRCHTSAAMQLEPPPPDRPQRPPKLPASSYIIFTRWRGPARCR